MTLIPSCPDTATHGEADYSKLGRTLVMEALGVLLQSETRIDNDTYTFFVLPLKQRARDLGIDLNRFASLGDREHERQRVHSGILPAGDMPEGLFAQQSVLRIDSREEPKLRTYQVTFDVPRLDTGRFDREVHNRRGRIVNFAIIEVGIEPGSGDPVENGYRLTVEALPLQMALFRDKIGDADWVVYKEIKEEEA